MKGLFEEKGKESFSALARVPFFFWLISGFIFLFLLSAPVSLANSFGVGLEVTCNPSWYCSLFSQGNCGERNCIDINSCGISNGRPDEFVECDEEEEDSSNPGGSRGSRGSSGSRGGLGYERNNKFDLSTDILKLEINNANSVSRKITVNASESSSFQVSYLENSKTRGNLVVEVLPSSFSITRGQSQEIEIKIDSFNHTIGLFPFKVLVSAQGQTKEINVFVNVNRPAGIFDFTMSLPSSNKIVNNESFINPNINIQGWMGEEFNVSYSILDENGAQVYIFRETINISESKDMSPRIDLPSNMPSGRYILEVILSSEGQTRSKYELFSVLPDSEFSEVLQTPSKLRKVYSKSVLSIFALGIVVILGIVLLFLGKGKAFVDFTSSNNKSKDFSKSFSREYLLLKSFKQGFISKEQYNELIRQENETNADKADVRTENAHKSAVVAYTYNEELSKEQGNKPSAKKEKQQSVLGIKSSEEEAFVLFNGDRLRSLSDLKHALKIMPDHVFNHHAKEGRNDFADWTLGALRLEEVSRSIRDAQNKDELLRLLISLK